MKRLIVPLFCTLLSCHAFSQAGFADSINVLLSRSPNDSVRYALLHHLYSHYEETQKDSALGIVAKMLVLAQKNRQPYSQAVCLSGIGYEQMGLGNYSAALNNLLLAQQLCEDSSVSIKNTWSVQGGTIGEEPPPGMQRLTAQAYINHLLGNLMWNTGNIPQSAVYFRNARDIAMRINNKVRLGMASMNLGRCYIYQGKPDSALVLEREAEAIAQTQKTNRYLGHIYTYLGDIAFAQNQDDAGLQYYHRAIEAGKYFNNLNSLSQAYYSITKFYLSKQNADSGIFYSRANIDAIFKLGSSFSLIYVNAGTAYQNLYKGYLLAGNKDSMAKYQVVSLMVQDSLNQARIGKLTDFQNALFQNQLRLQALEKQKLVSDSRNRTYLFVAGILFIFTISILLYRSNLVKQKDNRVLQQTLNHLKSTQAQLVHAEKMASLGELTAGIAHEIQNPLNFVNNFSEVNRELISELVDEVDKGNTQETKQIAADIKENSERIHHHGKRAEAIVKSMLQHSRTGSGEKEPTDINALCEEYLRLAFHARVNATAGQDMVANSNVFNPTLTTHFDNSIGMVQAIPQEIGRVLINVLNNAFYAVAEKGKTAGADYQPTVSITTRKAGQKVEITITDNGIGMPDAIREKIFQPFFTTKPTGEGTGLGLSLSYDIVTKGHGGEMQVQTKAGEGSTFIILL